MSYLTIGTWKSQVFHQPWPWQGGSMRTLCGMWIMPDDTEHEAPPAGTRPCKRCIKAAEHHMAQAKEQHLVWASVHHDLVGYL